MCGRYYIAEKHPDEILAEYLEEARKHAEEISQDQYT